LAEKFSALEHNHFADLVAGVPKLHFLLEECSNPPTTENPDLPQKKYKVREYASKVNVYFSCEILMTLEQLHQVT